MHVVSAEGVSPIQQRINKTTPNPATNHFILVDDSYITPNIREIINKGGDKL